MRTRTLIAVAFAVSAVVAACSGSGSSSSLTGKTWQLTAITEVTPAFQGVVPAADQPNYTIEFKSDLSLSAKADCNSVLGTYTTTSTGGLTIILGPSTLVACPEGSLAPQYVAGLSNAASYVVANSALTITLKDGGTLAFK
jgi:heat shock protein HslJ